MSFNPNNYYSFTREDETVTTAITEVPIGIKTLLNYSSGTRLKNYSTVNTWTVRGLKSLAAETTSIQSGPFIHQNSTSWCLVLTKNEDGFHLSFFLKRCSSKNPIGVTLRAYEILLTGEKREVFPNTWEYLEEGESSEMTLIRETVEGNNGDEITLQGIISMQCIIQDGLPVAVTAEPQVGVVKGTFEMLNREVHTDFELHAGGKILKAHKAMLSVRSPYFAAMLQSHTKEAQEGIVQVTDVDPEALKQVLLYMYTGITLDLKDMPWELLKAADKYQLPELKRQCEAHIAGCLTVDNAAETAANASVFSCDMLWDCTVLFIKRNLCKVMHTPGWTEAITTHPEAVKRISELMQ